MTGPDPLNYGWWLASRASGIVALVLVTLSVGLGLTMAGRLWRRPGMVKRLRTLHEHLALVGLFAIAVHGLTLLGDRWLHARPIDLVLPFTMGYRPALTGLGVIAGELAAVLGLSFYARRRIGARLWRRAHRATIVVWALGVIHAVGAGTDAHTLWFRAGIVITSVPIVALFLKRITTRPATARAAAARTRVAVPEGAR